MYFIGSIFLLFLETLIIWWLMPLTGLPYRPTWWQSFALAVVIDTMVSLPLMTYYLRLKNGD